MYGGNKFHVHYIALLTQAKQYAQKVNPRRSHTQRPTKERAYTHDFTYCKTYFSYWSSGHHWHILGEKGVIEICGPSFNLQLGWSQGQAVLYSSNAYKNLLCAWYKGNILTSSLYRKFSQISGPKKHKILAYENILKYKNSLTGSQERVWHNYRDYKTD